MGRLDKARGLLQLLAAAGTTTGFEFEKDRLLKTLSEKVAISKWILLLLVLLIAIYGLGKLFDKLVESSRLVRYCILRRHDIEGHWVDVTFDQEKAAFLNVAFIHITYMKTHFCVNGIAWYPDQGAAVCWETLQSDYSKHVLTYRYETWLSSNSIHREQGAGVLRFSGNGGRLSRYRGEFIDIYHRLRCASFGERVERGLFRLPTHSDELKKELAVEHCQRRVAALLEELKCTRAEGSGKAWQAKGSRKVPLLPSSPA